MRHIILDFSKMMCLISHSTFKSSGERIGGSPFNILVLLFFEKASCHRYSTQGERNQEPLIILPHRKKDSNVKARHNGFFSPGRPFFDHLREGLDF